MSNWRNSWLSHHGITGQKWGVRRYQNEDGTLTEEGRKRYLKGYEDMEREADKDIARATAQIADIEKNKWNASSAFSKGFVKQMKSEGMLNDDNLEYFTNVFRTDLESALANKKAAKAGREMIEKNANITYDDILKQTGEFDKGNKVSDNAAFSTKKLKENAEELGKELELKTKEQLDKSSKKQEDTTNLKVRYDDELEKQLRENYSEKEIKGLVSDVLSGITDKNLRNLIRDMVQQYPPAQQFAVILAIINGDLEEV